MRQPGRLAESMRAHISLQLQHQLCKRAREEREARSARKIIVVNTVKFEVTGDEHLARSILGSLTDVCPEDATVLPAKGC